jgi:hypothetical protein
MKMNLEVPYIQAQLKICPKNCQYIRHKELVLHIHEMLPEQ